WPGRCPPSRWRGRRGRRRRGRPACPCRRRGGPGESVASAEEPFVVVLLELGLDLLDRLQTDADDDDDRRTSEREVRHLQGVEGDERDERQPGEVERARGRDPVEHVLEVLRGGATRPDARD